MMIINLDYDYKKEVERIIYINDSLYTLSQGMIKSTNMNTMEEEDVLERFCLLIKQWKLKQELKRKHYLN